MIELGSQLKGLKIIVERTDKNGIPEAHPGTLLSCPISKAAEYKKTKDRIEWGFRHEAGLERYYLAESDGDQWYSHDQWVVRNATLKVLEGRTPMDMEVELHNRIMGQLFPGAKVHELIPGQPVTPKPDIKREAA